MNVSYEGIGYLAVTFPANACTAGNLCKLNLLGQVDICNSGDPFCGLVEAVENDTAAVQIQGFATVKFTGSTPPIGFTKLSSNGNGGVKLDTNGKEYLVVATDSANARITMKL